MSLIDPVAVLAIFAALALGGILKGATGAGAPILAVPVIASFYDVRLAIVIMVVPNLITNLAQVWEYRRFRLPGGFALIFSAGGALGAALGTALLANLSVGTLSLTVAAVVLSYVALRLARPGMRLAFPAALRLSAPMGLAAGVLQGASGISAPISLSFLNALRLERALFISTVSVFFTAMSLVQAAALFAYGILSPATLALSTAALLPLLCFMPLGAWLARLVSKETFDRLILAMLAVLAVKLVFSAL